MAVDGTCTRRPPGNKRLHKALPLLKQAIRALAHDTDLRDDPLWVAD